MNTLGYIGRGTLIHAGTEDGRALCNSVRTLRQGRNIGEPTCRKCRASILGEKIARRAAVKAPEPTPEAPEAPQADEPTEPTPASGFVPSAYQAAVFDFVSSGTGNAMVEAVAGSGKTTTLLHALELFPTTASIAFLAFNKAIAVEIQERVSGTGLSNVEARTFHSLGFAALRNVRSRKVDGSKVRRILKANLSRDDFTAYGSFVQKLVGLAKQTGVATGPGELLRSEAGLDFWHGIIDHHNLQLPTEDADLTRACRLAYRALSMSRAQRDVLDYDDMLYHVLLEGAKLDEFDVVLVDEAQDTNALQASMVGKMLAPGGRVIFVGDPRQAIYGFRGADASAIERICNRFDCTRLPLSVSYRCARAVVRAAQEFCPQIEAAPGAPEGEVRFLQGYNGDTFGAQDGLICRNKAPLVKAAYRLVASGTPFRFLGRDIGKNLQALISKLQGRHSMDVDQLLAGLGVWERRNVAKHLEADDEAKAEAIADQAECLRVVADALTGDERTVAGMVSSLSRLFEGDAGVILCTVHKSKGLEFPRVHILDAEETMPSRWAKRAWQLEQEGNLHYVAITRGIEAAVYITTDGWGRVAPQAAA